MAWGEPEWERWNRALTLLYGLVPLADFPARALSAVRTVVPCDKGDYTEVDLLSGDFRVFVDPEPVELASLREAREAVMSQHPVLQHFLRDDDAVPHAISDFLAPVEFRRLALYGEFFGPLGVSDQLTVTLDMGGRQRAAGVSIDRGRSGFVMADRVALERLRPHLSIARANAEAFSCGVARPSGDVPIERLSDRQREVLAHVAAGRTNGQIASQLSIRHGTVRKHLENILRLLEVPSRTAAAVAYAAAQPGEASQTWTASIAALVPAPRS